MFNEIKEFSMEKCASLPQISMNSSFSNSSSLQKQMSTAKLQMTPLSCLSMQQSLQPQSTLSTSQLVTYQSKNTEAENKFKQRVEQFYKNSCNKDNLILSDSKFKSSFCSEMNTRRPQSKNNEKQSKLLIQKFIQQDQQNQKQFERVKQQIESDSNSNMMQWVKDQKEDKVKQYITNKQIKHNIQSDIVQQMNNDSKQRNGNKQYKLSELKRQWYVSNQNFIQAMKQKQFEID